MARGDIKGCRCAYCRKAVTGGVVTLFAGPSMRRDRPFAGSCEGSLASYGNASAEDELNYRAYCEAFGIEPPTVIARLPVRRNFRLIPGGLQ